MNTNFNYQYHKKKILTNENTNRYANLTWAKQRKTIDPALISEYGIEDIEELEDDPTYTQKKYDEEEYFQK